MYLQQNLFIPDCYWLQWNQLEPKALYCSGQCEFDKMCIMKGVLQEILGFFCFPLLSWIKWIISALRELCGVGNMYSDNTEVTFQTKAMKPWNGLEWNMCINSQCLWDPTGFICLSCLLWAVFRCFSNIPWTGDKSYIYGLFSLFVICEDAGY